MRVLRGLILIALAACTGCSYTAAFYRSPSINQLALNEVQASRPRKKPEQIVFLREFPEAPHVVLGTLDAPETEWTAHYDTETLIAAMRKKAAELGADAIVDYRLQHNPTVRRNTRWSVSRNGISYRTTSVPYKGLHAWGEAILYVSADQVGVLEASAPR